jgi:hypothetical protein
MSFKLSLLPADADVLDSKIHNPLDTLFLAVFTTGTDNVSETERALSPDVLEAHRQACGTDLDASNSETPSLVLTITDHNESSGYQKILFVHRLPGSYIRDLIRTTITKADEARSSLLADECQITVKIENWMYLNSRGAPIDRQHRYQVTTGIVGMFIAHEAVSSGRVAVELACKDESIRDEISRVLNIYRR